MVIPYHRLNGANYESIKAGGSGWHCSHTCAHKNGHDVSVIPITLGNSKRSVLPVIERRAVSTRPRLKAIFATKRL